MPEPLGLLQLQLLVDEAAQHLRRQPLPGGVVVGQAAGGDAEIDPVDQILAW